MKIIEEISDGFLIVNREGKIVFFNEVFLKATGLRSTDIFAREKEFLKEIGVGENPSPREIEVVIEDRDGTPRRFNVSTLSVEGNAG
ncbi:MAG: hypothetical protein ACLQDL_09495, partial [Spirochaetia bacterium]